MCVCVSTSCKYAPSMRLMGSNTLLHLQTSSLLHLCAAFWEHLSLMIDVNIPQNPVSSFSQLFPLLSFNVGPHTTNRSPVHLGSSALISSEPVTVCVSAVCLHGLRSLCFCVLTVTQSRRWTHFYSTLYCMD